MTNPSGARDWLPSAACRDLNPQPFINPKSDSDVKHAQSVCGSCDVRRRCRDVALQLDPRADVGIWGGTTVADRRKIRRTMTPVARRRSKPAAATEAAELTQYLDHPRFTRTADGDHVGAAGRAIIAKLPTGDWMTLVDDRPVARTDTVAEGQQAAWRALAADSPLRIASRNPPRTARR